MCIGCPQKKHRSRSFWIPSIVLLSQFHSVDPPPVTSLSLDQSVCASLSLSLCHSPTPKWFIMLPRRRTPPQQPPPRPPPPRTWRSSRPACCISSLSSRVVFSCYCSDLNVVQNYHVVLSLSFITGERSYCHHCSCRRGRGAHRGSQMFVAMMLELFDCHK